MQKMLPELLSPVGGWEQLKAAVNNGADAIYTGGSLFNARMKADNFGEDDLKSAIDFAHERKVKVYVTLNTLIKDSEMEKAFMYACKLYEQGADAVILQDMGLARLIRKYIPGLPMHLSTQGTVYSKWAIDMVKGLGFTRVVPARELNLNEIKAMADECHSLCASNSCEIEVFVHGALCMCYSGQCQMSRLLGTPSGGGRSGNRGLCAQPCRLPYFSEDGSSQYILSPKDICTIDQLPALCEAGVDSLKIEGRLKSPEYVSVVTSIYRKYLDIYAETGIAPVSDEDRLLLLRIFNRGGFTEGYLHDNPGSEILSGASPKNQGVPLGKVIGVSGNPHGKVLLDVKLQRNPLTGRLEEISMGDGVEILPSSSNSRNQNTGFHRQVANSSDTPNRPQNDAVGNVVTYVKQLSDNTVRIGDFKLGSKRHIDKGSLVNKVTDKALLAKASATFTGNPGSETDRNLIRKTPVSMVFTGKVDCVPTLEMIVDDRSFIAKGEKPLEKALKAPANPSRIRDNLSKLGGTPFRVEQNNHASQVDYTTGDVSSCQATGAADSSDTASNNTIPNSMHICVDPDVMVPISLVNSLRRSCIEQALEACRKTERTKVQEYNIFKALEEIKCSASHFIDAEASQSEATEAAQTAVHHNDGSRLQQPEEESPDNRSDNNFRSVILIPLEQFMEETRLKSVDGANHQTRENADVAHAGRTADQPSDCKPQHLRIPYVLNVSKGNLDSFIESNFDEIVAAVKDTGIVLGNLGWIKRFQDAGVTVYGDYGLNVFNRQAEKLFAENGVKILAWSDECSTNGKHCIISNEKLRPAPCREPGWMQNVPMMITEHPVTLKEFADRKNAHYQVMKWSSGDKYLVFRSF